MIETTLTTSSFMTDPSIFEVALSLVLEIDVIYVYFPERAGRACIKNFFLQESTQLCCVLKVKVYFYSFILVSSRHEEIKLNFGMYD